MDIRYFGSTNCFECFFTQRLHSETHSIYTNSTDSSHKIRIKIFWISFERDFCCFGNILFKKGKNFLYFLFCEKRRSPSSKINTLKSLYSIFFLSFKYLFFEVFEVASFFESIKNRCNSKFTVAAFFATKRNVNIDMHYFDSS